MSQTTTSIWPRTGGNRSNQSRISIPGPSVGRVVKRILLKGLKRDEKRKRPKIAAGVVAADGSLRVAFYGVLYALAPEGNVLWSQSLPKYKVKEDDIDLQSGSMLLESEDSISPPHFYHSSPCIFNKNCTLITMSGTALMFDQHGVVINRIHLPLADDSGLSPNLTVDETPILDGVSIWEKDTLVDLHVRGYDIEPVAVYDDDTFAVSAYSIDGFRRIRRDGSLVWKTALRDADLVPTLNNAQFAAVGSFNDRCSLIFSPEGQPVGRYEAPAVFAVTLNDEWILRSRKQVARLTSSGNVLWEYAASTNASLSRFQPIIDSNERIYVVSDSKLIILDGDGKQVSTLELGESPQPIFPIKAGVFGVIVGDELLFIQ